MQQISSEVSDSAPAIVAGGLDVAPAPRKVVETIKRVPFWHTSADEGRLRVCGSHGALAAPNGARLLQEALTPIISKLSLAPPTPYEATILASVMQRGPNAAPALDGCQESTALEPRSPEFLRLALARAVVFTRWAEAEGLIRDGATASVETFKSVFVGQFALVRPLLENGPLEVENDAMHTPLELVSFMQDIVMFGWDRFNNRAVKVSRDAILSLVDWMVERGFDPLQSFDVDGLSISPLLFSMRAGGAMFYTLAKHIDNARLQEVLQKNPFLLTFDGVPSLLDLTYLAQRGVHLYAHNLGNITQKKLELYMLSRANASELSAEEKSTLWGLLSATLLKQWDIELLQFVIDHHAGLGGRGFAEFMVNKTQRPTQFIRLLYQTAAAEAPLQSKNQ